MLEVGRVDNKRLTIELVASLNYRILHNNLYFKLYMNTAYRYISTYIRMEFEKIYIKFKYSTMLLLILPKKH